MGEQLLHEEYHPEHREWTQTWLRPDGKTHTRRITHEQRAVLAGNGQAGSHMHAVVPGNISAPTYRQATPTSKALLPENASLIKGGTVLRWTSKGRFTYAAVFAMATQHWYLTGRGEWYGGNELTHEQMYEVLQRDEVTNIEVAEIWMDLDVLPF